MRHKPGARFGWPALPALAVLLAAAGCLDMPLPPPGGSAPEPPRIVEGPYLDGSMAAPTLRMRLSRPATVALRHDGPARLVERDAGYSLTPTLRVDSYLAQHGGKNDPVQLVVGERDARRVFLGRAPLPEETARIAFAAAPNPALADLLAGGDIDAVVLLAPPPAGADPGGELLRALGPGITRTALHLAPGAGAGLPGDLFPAANQPGWARLAGGVLLRGIDPGPLADPATRARARGELAEQLRRAPLEARLRVAVLSRAPFDGELDPELTQGLGDELEAAGFDLVLAPGRRGYWRTHPLASGRGGRTRFAALGVDNDIPDENVLNNLPQFIASHNTQGVAAGVLTLPAADAGGSPAVWEVFAHDGRAFDRARLGVDAAEPVFAKQGLLQEAHTLTLARGEIARIARQAARALEAPERPFRLPVAMENPADRPLTLHLAWEGAESPGRRWTVEPATAEVTLRPGLGALAWFNVSPAGGSGEVALRVRGAAGEAREPLLATRRRKTVARASPRPVTIDGRLHRREPIWAGFPDGEGEVIADFPGQDPRRPTRARLATDAEGLLAVFECVVQGNPRNIPLLAATPGEDHDHPGVLADEGVELWLDPAGRGRDWYRFAVNLASVRYEESSRGGVGFSPEWEAAALRDTRATPPRYFVEMRIPWGALGLPGRPAAGAAWGVNLVRRDAESTREAIQNGQMAKPARGEWAATLGEPERSGLYGLAELAGAAAEPEESRREEEEPAPPLGDPARFFDWNN